MTILLEGYIDYFFPALSGLEWMAFLFFLVVLEFWTLRLELSLVTCPTIEGFYFSMFLARQLSKILSCKTTMDWWFLAWGLSGMCFCVVERFCIGYAFHHIPAYEVEHNRYHLRLVERKLYGRRDHADDLIEVISYTLLFWCISLFVWQPGFWIGVGLEHYFGYRLRTIVQYRPTAELEKHKFLREANAFYWYHIVVNPQSCFGFSSPICDILFCGLDCTGASPLPFVGFFWSNFSIRHRKALEAGWSSAVHATSGGANTSFQQEKNEK